MWWPGGYGRGERPPRHSRTWTRDSNGLGRDAGPVGRCLRLVPNVARLAHDPPPAGELEQDAVRVLEVVRAHEHPGVQFPGHAELAVVVVHDGADPDALGLELGPVLEE